MNGILDAAAVVDHHLRQAGLRYCLIGGIALQRWGQFGNWMTADR